MLAYEKYQFELTPKIQHPILSSSNRKLGRRTIAYTPILSLYVQELVLAPTVWQKRLFSVRVCCAVLKLASAAATCCYNVESVGIDVCPRACADRHDLKQEVNECNNSKMSVFQKWWRQSCGKNIYEKKYRTWHIPYIYTYTLKESAILKMSIVGAHIIEKRQGSAQTHIARRKLHTFTRFLLNYYY